ncbi:pyrroline-5-carboxylate reductase [Maricaulis sp. CAU 1757]
MDILLVGCGKMGGAMLSRWVDEVPAQFTAVNRSGNNIPPAAAHAGNASALADRRFDAIIVAVKPQQIADIMPAYRDFLSDDGCFLSIAAGTSVESLRDTLGERPVIRLMPNLPALVGRSVNGLYASADCQSRHIKLATRLAEATGQAVWLDSEDEIDRITAVAGSGPGYVFEFLRAYIDAAEELGFSPETARRLVLETVAGSVEMASRSDQSAEELRNSVMSKKGTTEAGINALTRNRAFETLVKDATKAAYSRAQELR